MCEMRCECGDKIGHIESCRTPSFDNPIAVEHAYKLICLQNADLGGRDAISARGWLIHASWLAGERMPLEDGSYIYREPYVDGHLIHSNMSTEDILDMFDIDWLSLGISE